MVKTLLNPRSFVGQLGGRELVIETGRFAQQAGGAVTVRMGDTMLFCAATMSKTAREGTDFFPLTVEYEEKMYAGGRIPGSFFRREGRPSEGAILTSRVIDRTLRPLFPDAMRNEVQVILMSLSHDQENQVDMLGIIAASAALIISDVPWDGPVAGVRVGLIDGQLVVNPKISEMENSALDLRVSGTSAAINMVECGADEVDEDTMLKALKLARESIQPIIELQKQMRSELGKTKSEYVVEVLDESLVTAVRKQAEGEIRKLFEITDRHERNPQLDALKSAVVAEYETRNAELPPDDQISIKHVKEAFESLLTDVVRQRIVVDGVRPDGRTTTQIRPLAADVGFIPRVHGSGMFHRGETQVITIATLGSPRDSQLLDGLSPEENKRYLHHYNMPPYSTGETYALRGPKRREIGHGALAETALRAMIPPEDEFPYTVRLVSEAVSSNGSTSMASVCGSTLALMDAGVPIKRPVAGIAMGLIKNNDQMAVLTDIQGIEDHLGDMDFKVAGTTKGITALQMDIKITGVSDEVMVKALQQAREARLQILDVILEAIPQPRTELSEFAPRMESIKIDVDKIGAVIGPGGKNVRSIQESTKTVIEIQEDGTVYVAGPDAGAVNVAIEKIRGITEDAVIGRIYTGTISRIESYGVFVEFLPGKEGLVHVSQLADYRVENVADEFKVGDEIMVMVIDVDPGGKVRLSRQAVLEGWDVSEAQRRDRGSRGGGGNRGGQGGNRGGNDRNRGGGYRGGGQGGRRN